MEAEKALVNVSNTAHWSSDNNSSDETGMQKGHFGKENDCNFGFPEYVVVNTEKQQRRAGLLGRRPIDGSKKPDIVSDSNNKQGGVTRPSAISSTGVEVAKQITVESKLDPFAKEWNFWHKRAPEQDRCLYLTFSNGYPLEEMEIIRFFNQRYGACVERVYVHRPEPLKKPALFGKVVFTKSVVPAAVLSGQEETKFIVNGRTMWCKKFHLGKK